MRNTTYYSARRTGFGSCMCGATDCPSCGPAQGYDMHQEAINAVAEALLDKYQADPKWISEAAASLSDAEYGEIDQAHAERNAEKLFAVRDAAVRRVLTKWAEETARDDFEKLMRELEDEAAADAYDRRR